MELCHGGFDHHLRFFWPCNENRHRQSVFYGLKTVYVQSCGILTPYEICLGYDGQINQLTLTQPAPLLHRADGAWLDMSLVSSATQKRWTNCFLRVIPTLQDYSDIASDVPSGSIYIYIWHIYSDISGKYFDILSGILSGIYSDILSGILSHILSTVEVLQCRRSRLKSGSAHRSGARGWGTEIWSSLLGGGRKESRGKERKGRKEGRKKMKEGNEGRKRRRK